MTDSIGNLDLKDGINLLYLSQIDESILDKAISLKDSSVYTYMNYVTKIAEYNIKNEDKTKDNILQKKINHLSKDQIHVLENEPFIKNIKEKYSKIIKKIDNVTIRNIVNIINAVKTKNFENLSQLECCIALNTKLDLSIHLLTNMMEVPQIIDNKELFKKEVKKYKQSERFNASYTIKNIYTVNNRLKDRNKFKNKITLAHGTQNKHLIQILNDGFKKPSELIRNEEEVVIHGQALGDGIYFAKLEEIDKCIAYMDNKFEPYIIIANVYYNEEAIVNRYGENKRLTGTNMVHAVKMGQYERDEYVVLPNQIEITHILELTNKKG